MQWLVTTEKRFHGTLDFVHALLLLSEESTLLRYSSDYCDVSWYPSGFFIIEQDEPACNLFLILSGTVEVMREDPNGTQHVVAQMGPGSFFGEEGLAYTPSLRSKLTSSHSDRSAESPTGCVTKIAWMQQSTRSPSVPPNHY